MKIYFFSIICGLFLSFNHSAYMYCLYWIVYWHTLNKVVIKRYNHIAQGRVYTTDPIMKAMINHIDPIIFVISGIGSQFGHFCLGAWGFTKFVNFIWNRVKTATIAVNHTLPFSNKFIHKNTSLIFQLSIACTDANFSPKL